jgi:hypothetical protein
MRTSAVHCRESVRLPSRFSGPLPLHRLLLRSGIESIYHQLSQSDSPPRFSDDRGIHRHAAFSVTAIAPLPDVYVFGVLPDVA